MAMSLSSDRVARAWGQRSSPEAAGVVLASSDHSVSMVVERAAKHLLRVPAQHLGRGEGLSVARGLQVAWEAVPARSGRWRNPTAEPSCLHSLSEYETPGG